MKHLFTIAAALLVLASGAAWLLSPRGQTDVPVLYWVTNPYPTRQAQIEGFYRWLVDHGHTTPDGRPACEVRIDPSDFNVTKLVIQGVSGVSGDIIDLGDGTGMRYLHAVALLEDLTGHAEAGGFEAARTFSVLEPELTVDGRQYAFPCQTYAYMFNVNLATFRKFGIDPPPRRWTWETFERIGRRFVEAANPPARPGGPRRRRVFFANEVRAMVMWRSLGVSIFNETLTRCTLDDPRYARALQRLHQWKYVDRLLPTEADLKEVATQFNAQFGGSRLQMFVSGAYAMIGIGRHAMPDLRAVGALELGAVEPPHGGFPNTFAGTRCATVYAGSRHKKLAMHFLSYLAGPAYNRMVVDDADGIPPDPGITGTEAYRRPPAYPNEWGTHAVFADAMNDIAIGGAYSPFVLPVTAYGAEWEAREAFMAGMCSAEEAGRRATRRVNEEIERYLNENPALRTRYEEHLQRQARIERRRSEGRLVSLSWIDNPVLRRYYRFREWGRE